MKALPRATTIALTIEERRKLEALTAEIVGLERAGQRGGVVG
jgi:hypothetical protein